MMTDTLISLYKRLVNIDNMHLFYMTAPNIKYNVNTENIELGTIRNSQFNLFPSSDVVNGIMKDSGFIEKIVSEVKEMILLNQSTIECMHGMKLDDISKSKNPFVYIVMSHGLISKEVYISINSPPAISSNPPYL